MAKSKNNPIVILRGKKCSVFSNDTAARSFYNGVTGAIFYKCGTIELGMRDLMIFQRWESLAPEFKLRMLKTDEARVIIASMIANEVQFITEQLAQVQAERVDKALKEEEMRNTPTMEEIFTASSIRANERVWARIQADNERKSKQAKLICTLGTGGNASTIKLPDGTVEIVQVIGKSAPSKQLELGYAALKFADNSINQGADTVEIHGLGDNVAKTLDEYAANWKANGWLNPAGKSPANVELVQSMFELYEKIKEKVSLGVKPA